MFYSHVNMVNICRHKILLVYFSQPFSSFWPRVFEAKAALLTISKSGLSLSLFSPELQFYRWYVEKIKNQVFFRDLGGSRDEKASGLASPMGWGWGGGWYLETKQIRELWKAAKFKLKKCVQSGWPKPEALESNTGDWSVAYGSLAIGARKVKGSC